MKPYEKLIQHWTAEGLAIARGVLEEVLQDFERRSAVLLPHDFREYLLNVDGMTQVGGQDCDGKGFAFWPLSRIRTVPEECAAKGVRTPVFDGTENYLAFADYMQWSWAYAIGVSKTESGRILQFGTRSPRIVAESFAEFADAYIRDSAQLYVAEPSVLRG